MNHVLEDCRSGARGRPFAPAPRGPGGCCRRGRRCFRRLIGNCRALRPRIEPRPGNVGVARSSAPIDRRLEGYHHDPRSANLHGRIGPRRRQINALGLPRHEGGRSRPEQARGQLGRRARRPVLPSRRGGPGGRRPAPQHRRAGDIEGDGGRAGRGLPARNRRAPGVQAVRGRRQDRREGRAGHRQDRAGDTRIAEAGREARREARRGPDAGIPARLHGDVRDPRQEQAEEHPAGKLRRVRGPGGRVRRRMARRPGAAGRRVGHRRCGQAAPEGGREGRPRRQDRCLPGGSGRPSPRRRGSIPR